MVDHGITKIRLSVTPRLDVLPKRGSRFYMVKETGRQLRIFCLKFSIMGFFGCLNRIIFAKLKFPMPFFWTR